MSKDEIKTIQNELLQHLRHADLGMYVKIDKEGYVNESDYEAGYTEGYKYGYNSGCIKAMHVVEQYIKYLTMYTTRYILLNRT